MARKKKPERLQTISKNLCITTANHKKSNATQSTTMIAMTVLTSRHLKDECTRWDRNSKSYMKSERTFCEMVTKTNCVKSKLISKTSQIICDK